jgi:hypothetical protein
MLTDVYFHQSALVNARCKEELIVDMMFMLPGATRRVSISINVAAAGNNIVEVPDGRACTLYIRGPIPQKNSVFHPSTASNI